MADGRGQRYRLGAVLAWASTRRFDDFERITWVDKFAVVGSTLLSTMLTASALAFFGFILEIGVGCWEQVWHLRYAEEDDVPDLGE